MSNSVNIINRAYGNIPKEITQFELNLDSFPFRGVRYYWLLLKRKFTR